jgi:hypothetical protein
LQPLYERDVKTKTERTKQKQLLALDVTSLQEKYIYFVVADFALPGIISRDVTGRIRSL